MTNTKLQASPQRLPTQTRSKGTGVHGVRVSSEGIEYNGRDWTFPPQKEAGSSSRGPGPALTQSYKHSSHLASQMDAACPISVCSVFQKRPIMYTLFQQRKNKSISADPVSPRPQPGTQTWMPRAPLPLAPLLPAVPRLPPLPREAPTLVLDVLFQDCFGITQHPLRSSMYQFVMGHAFGIFQVPMGTLGGGGGIIYLKTK